jgi:hypothetical protein
VLSMKSVIENLSSILGAPLMGRILWYISFSQGLFLAGGLLLVMGGLYIVVWKKTSSKILPTCEVLYSQR